MATVAQLITDVTTAVEALVGTPARQTDDYARRDLVTAGETHYQLRVSQQAVDETADANTNYDVIGIELDMHHSLASAADERAYTEANMLTHQSSLTSRSWWHALGSVFNVFSIPAIEEGPDRLGNVITYRIAVAVRLVP